MTDEQFEDFRASLLGEIAELRGAFMGELGKLSRKQDDTRTAVDRIADRQFEREFEQDRYRRRTKALEAEVERFSTKVEGPNWVRNPQDITGVHQLHDLTEWKKRKEKEEDENRNARRDSGVWWKRQKRTVAIGVVASLFLMLVTSCVTYAVSHVEVKVPTPSLRTP